MDEKNIFAMRMKEARQKADISQAELSRRTSIAAATLSSYESTENPKNPTIDKVILIAKALNVSIDWLCGLDNKEKDNENIGFDEVMKALSLLLSICGIKFKANESENIPVGEPFSTIDIYSYTMTEFLCEYSRIVNFINDTEYPRYLKDGLKKAMFEKFNKYYIENETGLICADGGNLVDGINIDGY